MTGGKRPGAGRKPGVPNKARAALQAAVSASGETPLEFLTGVFRDAAIALDVRLDAAKAAAPYVHARLSTIDVGNKDGQPLVVNIVRFADQPSE